MVRTAARRAAAACDLQTKPGLSEQPASSIVGADQTLVRYRSCLLPDTALRAPESTESVGREEGLTVRKRRTRRKACGGCVPTNGSSDAKCSPVARLRVRSVRQ